MKRIVNIHTKNEGLQISNSNNSNILFDNNIFTYHAVATNGHLHCLKYLRDSKLDLENVCFRDLNSVSNTFMMDKDVKSNRTLFCSIKIGVINPFKIVSFVFLIVLLFLTFLMFY